MMLLVNPPQAMSTITKDGVGVRVCLHANSCAQKTPSVLIHLELQLTATYCYNLSEVCGWPPGSNPTCCILLILPKCILYVHVWWQRPESRPKVPILLTSGEAVVQYGPGPTCPILLTRFTSLGSVWSVVPHSRG